jgi:cytochrome c biogenesis protein CcdA
VLVAAYAAGVLMFFAPCNAGLFSAYLSYFYTHEEGPEQADDPGLSQGGPIRTVLFVNGIILLLAGAVPLLHMVVAGI